MEYKVVMENKRGDKYVLMGDVLKNSKLSKESLDKLETYNILVYSDVVDSTINIKCYLLSDVEKLENEDDDVEIWDDEFEDEDMEMSPEELEDNNEYETKLEYLYRKYDCNDMETLQYRCPIDIKAYKQFTCLNSEATDEFKRLIDEREEKENEAIMKIVEERNKKERNIRYTSDDTETIFKSFFTI